MAFKLYLCRHKIIKYTLIENVANTKLSADFGWYDDLIQCRMATSGLSPTKLLCYKLTGAIHLNIT